MTTHLKAGPVVAVLLLAGWVTFWFWAFSSADSDGFFLYHRHSRIPIFAAALLAATLIPISAAVQWRRYHKARRSGLRSLLTHSTTCLVVMAAFLAVFWGLSAAEPPWRPEADDAMGAAYGLMALLGIAALSITALAVAVAVHRYRRPG